MKKQDRLWSLSFRYSVGGVVNEMQQNIVFLDVGRPSNSSLAKISHP